MIASIHLERREPARNRLRFYHSEGHGQPMNQVVIDNPAINSPFAESRRHFRFDDHGMTLTHEILTGRRRALYLAECANRKRANLCRPLSE
jgi:hypothetical protein